MSTQSRVIHATPRRPFTLLRHDAFSEHASAKARIWRRPSTLSGTGAGRMRFTQPRPAIVEEPLSCEVVGRRLTISEETNTQRCSSGAKPMTKEGNSHELVVVAVAVAVFYCSHVRC